MTFAIDSDTERAFLKAREILRKADPLTSADCNRLDGLFYEMESTQFIALAQDPQHTRALREYDRRVRLSSRPLIAIMTGLFTLSMAMGLFTHWQHWHVEAPAIRLARDASGDGIAHSRHIQPPARSSVRTGPAI